MDKNLEMSQYLCAKLCHDLSGVLGAINSGSEFLDLDNTNMRERAVELVKSSAEEAVNRLMFIRNAYGIAKIDGEADLASIRKLTTDYLKQTKVNLDFHEKYFHIPGCYVSTNTGKLILCLIQYAYYSLIHGGTIKVKIENKDGKTIVIISALGEKLKSDELKYSIIKGDASDIPISSSNVTAFYINLLKNYLNHTIDIDPKDSTTIDFIIY